MMSKYLKVSEITTHSTTFIEDLKSKSEERYTYFQKMYVFCTLVSRNSLVEHVSKEIAFPVLCRTKHSKPEGSNFLSWASIAPT